MKHLRHYYDRIESVLRSHPWWFGISLVLLAATLAITRRPDVFFNAQFWAEDGAVWYTDAYHSGFWQTILKPYPDYFAIPQRLFAFAGTLIPFNFAPLFFNLAGLGFQLLPIVLLASGQLRRLVPSKLLTVLVAVTYIALPNSAEVFSTFANAQWHLGLAALLIIVAARTKHKAWRIFNIAVLVASGLSGPLIIFLAPVACLVWWFDKKRPEYLQNLLLIAGLALVQLGALVFANPAFRDGTPPDPSTINLVKMIAGQIVTGGILGQNYIGIFYEQHLHLYITLALALTLTGYAIIKGPMWLKLLNVYPPILITALLITLKNPPGASYDLWLGLTNPTGGQRYWYIPIAVWVTTVIWLAFAAKLALIRGISIVLIIMLVTIGVPQGWRLSPLNDYRFKTYAQQFQATPRGQPFTFPINPGGWKMTLYKK